MWHSLGFTPDDQDGETGRAGDAYTVNAVKDELLAAARDAVVESRAESGTDPTIADSVLRQLDARGSQPQ
jgi:CPA1 family monovalent cation:H+ antiporter